MAKEGFKRKLSAILSADVEGYSRLMDDDEEATICTLTSYRKAIPDLSPIPLYSLPQTRVLIKIKRWMTYELP